MIGMIKRDWNQYFFGQRPATTLALYRILFGIVVMSWCVLIFPDLKTWYTENGLFNIAAMKAFGGGAYGFDVLAFRVWTRNVFGTPMLSNVTSYSGVLVVFWLLAIAAFMQTIGYKTRFASIAVYLLLTSFHHRDIIILNGGDTLMRVMSFLMIFANSGAAISVDRLIKVWKGGVNPTLPVLIEAWPQRLMQLQLAAVYVSTVLGKLTGDEWRDGTAFYYASSLTELQRFPFHGLNNDPWFFVFASYFTLFAEFAMATFVFVPRLRPYALMMGIAIHLGIEYSMVVPLFSFTIIGCYMNFVEQGWIVAVVNRLHTRFEKFQLALPLLRLPQSVRRVYACMDSLHLVAESASPGKVIDEGLVWKSAWRLPAVWAVIFIPLIDVALIRPLPWFLVVAGIVWPLVLMSLLRIIIQRLCDTWKSNGTQQPLGESAPLTEQFVEAPTLAPESETVPA